MLPATGSGDRPGLCGGTCCASLGSFPSTCPSISLRDLFGSQKLLHRRLQGTLRPCRRQSPSSQPSAMPCPMWSGDPAALWPLPQEHERGGRCSSPHSSASS